MIRAVWRLIVIGVLIACCQPVFSNDHFISIENGLPAKSIGRYLSFYEDKGGQVTITDLIMMDETGWVKSNRETPNFSFTESVYWFKADVINTGINTVNGLLEISNPLLDDIEFYFLHDGDIESYSVSGSKHDYLDRQHPHRNFLFSFSLPEKEAGTLYLRVVAHTSFQVPAVISSVHEYYHYDQSDLSGKSAYYGMMIIIMLFNLFLYISLREPVYLFYILFVFGFSAQQFSMHGFLATLVFPSYPGVQAFFVLFLMSFTIFFASVFSRYFLSMSTTAPKFNLAFKGFELAAVILAVLLFFVDYAFVAKSVAILAVGISVLCVIVGPYLWHKGHTIARFYSFAWFFVASGSAILALNKLGVVPRNGFTENGLLFGSSAEAILLSLALADRLNVERLRRFEAQQAMLDESENRKKAEHKLLHAALHHTSTGFPNRMYFERWFNGMVKETHGSQNLAFGLVHLNRFHEINQTLGHALADELFHRVVQRINTKMKNSGCFLRIEHHREGGYYGAVIEGVYIGFLIDCDKVEDVSAVIKNLLSCLSEPLEFQEMFIDVGAAGGWVNYNAKTHDGTSLIRNALIAVDVGDNHNDVVIEYSDGINPYSERRLALVGDLRRAIEKNQLQVHFQPQYSVKQSRYSSMEALLRWTHPEYGFIPPDEFIPIAEQSGIIHLLTKWVLDASLAALVKLNSSGLDLSLAVNISAVNLRDKHFSEMVQSILDQHKVPHYQLVLEVTETAMMHDPELALTVLTEISELGVKLSIDDFGTGHSSLAYIKQLPVQEIKIDRSFVMDMAVTKDDAIIVNTTINMCHDLGLEVVAEGVESLDIGESLKVISCDYLQGYGLCRPLPLTDVTDFLIKQKEES